MRISDWSSDVCSSDLLGLEKRRMRGAMPRLILFNKPYGVLCQFTDRSTGSDIAPARPTLSDFIDLPGVYPAGRLDLDSEGLLLLTDDGRRTEERRVGKECVGTCRAGGSPSK